MAKLNAEEYKSFEEIKQVDDHFPEVRKMVRIAILEF